MDGLTAHHVPLNGFNKNLLHFLALDGALNLQSHDRVDGAGRMQEFFQGPAGNPKARGLLPPIENRGDAPFQTVGAQFPPARPPRPDRHRQNKLLSHKKL
jgi:hypothetical protein